jgi:hypothetical protein
MITLAWPECDHFRGSPVSQLIHLNFHLWLHETLVASYILVRFMISGLHTWAIMKLEPTRANFSIAFVALDFTRKAAVSIELFGKWNGRIKWEISLVLGGVALTQIRTSWRKPDGQIVANKAAQLAASTSPQVGYESRKLYTSSELYHFAVVGGFILAALAGGSPNNEWEICVELQLDAANRHRSNMLITGHLFTCLLCYIEQP